MKPKFFIFSLKDLVYLAAVTAAAIIAIIVLLGLIADARSEITESAGIIKKVCS